MYCAPEPSSSHLKGLRQLRKKKIDANTKTDVAVAVAFLAAWCSRATNSSYHDTSESGGWCLLARFALMAVRTMAKARTMARSTSGATSVNSILSCAV